VVKIDGLAAGKGVLVAESLAEAIADVEAKLSGAAFGAAGRRVVIEEGMAGPECSLMALCDGRHVVALAPAQDAKRLGEGDAGPNTGGMGAFSPIPALDAADVDSLMDTAVEPLLAALRTRGIDYRGVLYAGLMLTDEGPKVLEYNVRFGDPEAECVLVRLASDPFELLASVAGGSLQDAPRFTDDAAVCVVVASPGYPGATETGGLISGLDQRGQLEVPIEGVTVFHAGTARDAEGRFVTAGGRVLGITAVARGPEEARRRAYAGVAGIGWPGAQVRTDIGAAANTIGSAR
jgi:phosphoribosylamine--glycine ligase